MLEVVKSVDQWDVEEREQNEATQSVDEDTAVPPTVIGRNEQREDGGDAGRQRCSDIPPSRDNYADVLDSDVAIDRDTANGEGDEDDPTADCGPASESRSLAVHRSQETRSSA